MAVRVRRATAGDAAGIATVQVDTWRSAYEGIVPDDHLANLSYERSQRMWEGHLSKGEGTIFVAEDSPGHLLGFASCGPARDNKEFDGEIYAIYVTPAAQGKGTGRRLVLSAGKEMASRGFRSMLVWVLAENPHRRFYESLGGEQVSSKYTVIGGENLKELGYGWKDLDSLISRLSGG